MSELTPEMHRDAIETGGTIADIDVESEGNDGSSILEATVEEGKKKDFLQLDPEQIIQEAREEIQEAKQELQEIENLEKFVPELVRPIQQIAEKLIKIRQKVGIDHVEGDRNKPTFADLEEKLRRIDSKDGESIYKVLLQLYALGNERIPEGLNMLDGPNGSVEYLLREIFIQVSKFKEAWQDYATAHTDDEEVQDMETKEIEQLDKIGTTDYEALESTKQRIKKELESVATAIVNDEQIQQGIEKGENGEYPLPLSSIGTRETQYTYVVKDLRRKISSIFARRLGESDIYWASRQAYSLEYSVKQIMDLLTERKQALHTKIALAEEKISRAQEQSQLKSRVDVLQKRVTKLEKRISTLEELL